MAIRLKLAWLTRGLNTGMYAALPDWPACLPASLHMLTEFLRPSGRLIIYLSIEDSIHWATKLAWSQRRHGFGVGYSVSTDGVFNSNVSVYPACILSGLTLWILSKSFIEWHPGRNREVLYVRTWNPLIPKLRFLLYQVRHSSSTSHWVRFEPDHCHHCWFLLRWHVGRVGNYLLDGAIIAEW